MMRLKRGYLLRAGLCAFLGGLCMGRGVRLLVSRPRVLVAMRREPARGVYQCQYCGARFEEWKHNMQGVRDIWCGQCEPG